MNGADRDSQDENKYSALIWAVIEGHTSTVKLLIEAGVNINLRDISARTALIYAASQGRL